MPVQRVHAMPARQMEEQLRPVPQGGFLQAQDPDHQVRAVCRRVRVRARTGEGGVQAVHRSRDLPARNVEGEVQDVQRVAEEPVPPRPSELLLQDCAAEGIGGKGICEHNKEERRCRDCKGWGLCPHGKVKTRNCVRCVEEAHALFMKKKTNAASNDKSRSRSRR